MLITKQIIANAFKLGAAIKAAKEDDGKIDWTDIAELATPSISFVTDLGQYKELHAEWKASSPEERKALCEQLKQDFDLADDELEKKIETFVEAGFAIMNVILL